MICPHCQAANPDRADVCGQCSAALFAVAPIPSSGTLPAPMIEPIHTPSKPPPDSKPLLAEPALTAAFTVNHALFTVTDVPHMVRSGATPAPLTLHDLPAADSPTHGRIAGGGTLPAHTGLPLHPMNEAVVQNQNSPATILATSPADQPPAEIPPAPPTRPKLIVLRGVRLNAEFPIYEGRNIAGRFADKPVDIDLMAQETLEQIWCSRQHAVFIFDKGIVMIEDLNSLNGTWVNGNRVHPGQPRQLKPGDVVQVGTVQMKLVFA